MFSLVTHIFNGMSSLHHRQPGVLGAVLSSDVIMGMVIPDGVHVHPAALKILLRSLGPERVIAVTDATAGAGMSEGMFSVLNQEATIVDGVARLMDGTIAGSILTMNRAVMNLSAFTGLSMNNALQLGTVNPARALGWSNKGWLGIGSDADVAVMDERGNVLLTMVEGEIVYKL